MTILSTVATIGGIGGALSEILGTDQTNVTLGEITFSGIALPGAMRWGGRQRLSRQQAPGGAVLVTDLGTTWEPIAWQGTFEGPGAAKQAQQVYAAMKTGKPLVLAWLDQQWLVVIRQFAADDTTTGWVPYRITCEVLADASAFAGPAGPPSLGERIIGDINNALGFNVVDAANQAASLLGKVQQAANLAGAITKGGSAFTGVASAAGLAAGAVGGAVTLAETGINGLSGVVSGAAKAVSWVDGAATQAGNLANAVAANGFIGRVTANLSHAST